MTRRAAALALVTLAIGACTVGPTYVAPSAPQAAAGPFLSASPTLSAATEPPQDWWRLFRDPALDGLISQALAANTDLRVAAANLAEARAVLEQARAGRLPFTSIDAGASYGRAAGGAQGGSSGAARTSLRYSTGLDISYEVDLFGRVRRSIEAASGDVEATAAARDVVRVSVAAETTRAYLDACAYGRSLAVARRSLQNAGESFGVLEVRKRAGAASDVEVVRGQSLLAQTRATIPPLEAQRRSALYRLAVLTGRPPAQVPAAAAACVSAPEPDSVLPVGDGAALLRRRPDIRQAERRLAAATARIGVATAELYPSITLGGGVSSAASAVGGLFRGDSIGFSLGPLLRWDFPNQSLGRARVRQAEARTAAALASFDGAVLGSLQETEQSLAQYAGQLQRRGELRAAVASDTEALRLARLRFEAGAAPFLELLDAQRTLIADESALASADLAIADARVNLFKALGGGWAARTENLPPT